MLNQLDAVMVKYGQKLFANGIDVGISSLIIAYSRKTRSTPIGLEDIEALLARLAETRCLSRAESRHDLVLHDDVMKGYVPA
jgi:hypothetical protein